MVSLYLLQCIELILNLALKTVLSDIVVQTTCHKWLPTSLYNIYALFNDTVRICVITIHLNLRR